ncbi:MAG: MFS transporter [Acidithiobacillales bacterium]
MAPDRRPYAALRHPDLRRYASGMFVSIVGSQMQNTAIDWHVWVLTGSPLALGAVGLARFVPVVAVSLAGGVAADRYDRRRILLATQSVMLASAAALAILTLTGRVSLAAIYLLTGLTAGANAFDSPARHSFVPRLVPAADLSGALTVLITSFQLAAIGGPALTGVVLARGHALAQGAIPTGALAGVYGLNALSFLSVIGALLRIHPGRGAPAAESRGESPVVALKEGFRFVFRTPLIVWTMLLDFVATFLSGSMSLLPIFADRILHIGAAGYGWLRAAPAVGAALGSTALAIRGLPRRQGTVFLAAVAAYGATTALFGVSRSAALTFAALLFVGMSDTVSTVIRQTIRQLATPDALRGRMTSVNMIFFLGGPQLGEMEAGVVASLFASAALGATVAVASGGAATVLVAAVAAWCAPFLLGYDVVRAVREAEEPRLASGP